MSDEEIQKVVDKMKEGNYYIKDPSKGTMRMDDKVLLTFYEPTGKKEEGKSAVMDMDIEEAEVLVRQVASAIDLEVKG